MSMMTATDDRPPQAKQETRRQMGRWEPLGLALSEIVGIFQRSPEWLIIIFAWCAAAFFPYYWYMGETDAWIDPSSVLFFQPFVPLAVAALLWQDREKLNTARQSSSSSKRRGSPWVIWLGCIGLLISHLIHVLTFAIVSLLLIAVGIVYLAYGKNVLLQSRRALLFGVIMIPPPVTLTADVDIFVSNNLVKAVTAIAQKAGRADSVTLSDALSIFDIQGHTVYAMNTEASSVFLVGFVLLFWNIWARRSVMDTLMAMASGALVALAINFGSLLLALLLPVNPLTDVLSRAHPLVVALLTIVLMIVLLPRLRPLWSKLARSTSAVEKLSNRVEKMTDRAVGSVNQSVGRSVGGTGKSVTKMTERAIDNAFRSIGKLFKRNKRKGRW